MVFRCPRCNHVVKYFNEAESHCWGCCRALRRMDLKMAEPHDGNHQCRECWLKGEPCTYQLLAPEIKTNSQWRNGSWWLVQVSSERLSCPTCNTIKAGKTIETNSHLDEARNLAEVRKLREARERTRRTLLVVAVSGLSCLIAYLILGPWLASLSTSSPNAAGTSSPNELEVSNVNFEGFLPSDRNDLEIGFATHSGLPTFVPDKLEPEELSEAAQHKVTGDELYLPSSEVVTIYIASNQPILSAQMIRIYMPALDLIPYESNSEGRRVFWIRTWGSVAAMRGAKIVIQRNGETKTLRLVQANLRSATLVGTWYGSHRDLKNAILTLHESESMGTDTAYGGTVTGIAKGKSLTIDVDVELRRSTGDITITESAVRGDRNWALGVNRGTMTGPDSMAGEGKDKRGSRYNWSYFRG